MHKVEASTVKAQGAKRSGNRKKYVRPEAVSMEAFTLKTAVGVSPALKREDNYIVSTLF